MSADEASADVLAHIDAVLAEPAPSLSWLVAAPKFEGGTERRAFEAYRCGSYRQRYPLAWDEIIPAGPDPEPVPEPESTMGHPLTAPREHDPYDCRVDWDCGGCSCFVSAPCHHCMEHTNADGTSIDPDALTCPQCCQEVEMTRGERIETHWIEDITGTRARGPECEMSGERVSVCARA